MGRQFTIDRPEWVNLVNPPSTTMAKTMIQTTNNQFDTPRA